MAVQFFLVAPYVALESVKTLVGGEHPDISWVGIGLSIGLVIFMPMLGIAKQRLADQLGSGATAGEGRQNILCAYLAAGLLVGLIGNALVGAWWLDPAVGLLIAASRSGRARKPGAARAGACRPRSTTSASPTTRVKTSAAHRRLPDRDRRAIELARRRAARRP